MNAASRRTWAAFVLQVAALAALSLSLLGVSWLDARTKPRWLVLVDRSDSVPRAAADQALADVADAVRAAGGRLQRIEFAGKTGAPAGKGDAAAVALEPSSTHIEAALDAALALHADAPLAGVVVISDGQENVGDAERALRGAREARLPLQWAAIARAAPPTRIVQVLAPGRARVGQRVQVTVQLAGVLDRALRIEASARGPSGEMQTGSTEVVDEGRATIVLDASHSGPLLVDVSVRDPASGATIDASADAAVIDVAPRAAVLYVKGSSGSFSQSLLGGGWSLDVVPVARLDGEADGLDAYQAVVLDDVAVSDAGPRFWNALAVAVRERGLGLLVLGGERSFARGGYRGSTLESLLPVSSEPAALDQPASVVFAVDKSGSMGEGSGGVERFQLAQRAVLETARGLGPRDSLGLLVFDVAPRVIVPLGPAADRVAALGRDWRASPNGGTRIGPALEAAIGELERSGTGRRLLVVVTDGFSDDGSNAELHARLARARIETIALAIGPDADVAALQRLFGSGEGQVVRVSESAELPGAMRSGLERRRARVERGVIAVEQRQALPFHPGTLADWPAIAAHAVTRSQPAAVVAVQSRQGEPLIAFQRSGRGRVVAVTSGFGAWTPGWLSWREWPLLAGGLADWLSGTSQGRAAALTVSDLPDGLLVEADLPSAAATGDGDPTAIAVTTPTTASQSLRTQAIAPSRVRAMLPDAGAGLYTFVVTTPYGTERRLHLRQRRAESATWGVNPALEGWRAAGLVAMWDPRAIATAGDRQRGSRPLDRSLIALALALFLGGVLVDRARIAGLARR